MTVVDHPGHVLTGRDRAILAAVDAGRAELSCSSEPDLFVDGLCCCDQDAVHRLFHAGLITGATPGAPGSRVTALLTRLGRMILSAPPSSGAHDGSSRNSEPSPTIGLASPSPSMTGIRHDIFSPPEVA